MTVIWMGLAGIALACMAAGFVVGMLLERSHWERQEFDAEIAEHEKRIEARAAGRHRMSQPRAALPLRPAAVPTEPKPGPVTLPSGGAIGVFLARNYRAARGVDTVLLAPQPSPSLTGAADTGTMPRVQLPADVTDTGELRAIEAIGDDLVAQIERGELV